VESSAQHAQALILLANIELHDGRLESARRLLEGALAVDPTRTAVHAGLAALALDEGRPRDALLELAHERRISGPGADLDVVAGRAWQVLGDRHRARAAYRDALRRDSSNTEARDSLASMARADRG
jgi:Tfp pilus assembly protein PilF